MDQTVCGHSEQPQKPSQVSLFFYCHIGDKMFQKNVGAQTCNFLLKNNSSPQLCVPVYSNHLIIFAEGVVTCLVSLEEYFHS